MMFMRKYCLFALLPIFWLLVSCNGPAAQGYHAVNGVMDMTNFSSDPLPVLKLDGGWKVIPNRFVAPDASDDVWEQASVMVLPAPWNDERAGNYIFKGHDHATFRLKVKTKKPGQMLAIKVTDIESAYTLFVDQDEVLKVGQPSTSTEGETPQFRPTVVHFLPKSPNFTLTLFVSNYHQNRGGIIGSLLIGNSNDVDVLRQTNVTFQMLLFGALFIMGLYHFGLYSLRQNDFSTLTFGLFSIVISVRSLVLGERFITFLYPALTWEMLNKIDYLSFHISLPLFMWFMYNIYREEASKMFTVAISIISFFFAATTIFTSKLIYSHTLIPYQLVAALACAYVVFWIMPRAIMHKREGARMALGGLIFLAVMVINDLLYNNQIIQTGNFVPLGLFVFTLSQSFLLSQRFANAFNSIERLTENLIKTNAGYSRFVPVELLGLLGKESIVDLHLGDQTARRMAILFSDIRSFAVLTESMSPGESFEFINSYLQQMSPIIKTHNGFIDKYIGDAIMALFHRTPSDAIAAAIQMQKTLRDYNRKREKAGRVPIRIGIGVHTGDLIFGTVGSEERMDGTVISDAVNLASRLEGLTKKFGISIVASEDILKDSAFELEQEIVDRGALLSNMNRFSIRHLGKVHVKGKSEAVSIYEVYDCDPDDIRELKDMTRNTFEAAVNYYLVINIKKLLSCLIR